MANRGAGSGLREKTETGEKEVGRYILLKQFLEGEEESTKSKGKDLRPHASGDFPTGRRASLGTFVVDSFSIPIIL